MGEYHAVPVVWQLVFADGSGVSRVVDWVYDECHCHCRVAVVYAVQGVGLCQRQILGDFPCVGEYNTWIPGVGQLVFAYLTCLRYVVVNRVYG